MASNSWRSFAWLIGFWTTKVPAAPTLNTPSLASLLARTLGRKILCPPTLTPFKKTTEAIDLLSYGERLFGVAPLRRNTFPPDCSGDYSATIAALVVAINHRHK
jgi:hypothetical protein